MINQLNHGREAKQDIVINNFINKYVSGHSIKYLMCEINGKQNKGQRVKV